VPAVRYVLVVPARLAQPLAARPGARQSPRLISVLIPVLNGAEDLPHQLEALHAQDYTGAWEVVIADNGSTDASVAIAERWVKRFSRGRVVRTGDRISPGHARNVGAAHARGDFLVFTDADDAPRPGWLTAMAQGARRGDLVAGGIDVDGLNDARSRSWHATPPRERALHGFRFLPFASGTNTGVWADVFEDLGGFDEETIVAEDIEFSWRAQLASYRVVSAPNAMVEQRLRSRVGSLARQHYRYGTSGPNLYRSFRDSGMPRARATEALRKWAWILGAWPAAAWSERVRGRWALEAALACGRVVGSVRNRVLFV
jgi:glycosyltransferase involved in cell wall biosynthesis